MAVRFEPWGLALSTVVGDYWSLPSGTATDIRSPLPSPAADEGKNTKLFLAVLGKWMTPEQLQICFAEKRI